MIKSYDNSLSEHQIEIIDIFVQLSRLMGFPNSLGVIYGFLFVSLKPVNSEQISQTVKISAGSVSQGLRTLQNLGAIRTVYVPGARKAHYEANLDYRFVLSRYLSEVFLPRVSESKAKIGEMQTHVTSDSDHIDDELKKRIQILNKLFKKLDLVLPLLGKVFDK